MRGKERAGGTGYDVRDAVGGTREEGGGAGESFSRGHWGNWNVCVLGFFERTRDFRTLKGQSEPERFFRFVLPRKLQQNARHSELVSESTTQMLSSA